MASWMLLSWLQQFLNKPASYQNYLFPIVWWNLVAGQFANAIFNSLAN